MVSSGQPERLECAQDSQAKQEAPFSRGGQDRDRDGDRDDHEVHQVGHPRYIAPQGKRKDLARSLQGVDGGEELVGRLDRVPLGRPLRHQWVVQHHDDQIGGNNEANKVLVLRGECREDVKRHRSGDCG